MKSIYIKFLVATLILLVLVGCSNIEESISKEEAQKLVIEKHTNSNGTPVIQTTEIKNNAYYIQWENTSNKESGIDKVTKDGEIEMIEAQIE